MYPDLGLEPQTNRPSHLPGTPLGPIETVWEPNSHNVRGGVEFAFMSCACAASPEPTLHCIV